MRNSAMAAWVALALGGVALPSMATAQDRPRDDIVDASGWSLESANRSNPAESPSKPLAVLDDSPDASEAPSQTAAILTNWIIASGDNGERPFMVIDKVAAKVFLFDAHGEPVGATPALLGITPGDDSAPGVGDRELSNIKPEDRTTPAGRFVAKFGRASGSRNVLWVDYATSISLHAVITTNKKERRLQRLKSPSAKDNRITFGCINVPAKFYQDVVRPLFADTSGIVYILPESKNLVEVFPAFRPDLRPASFAEEGR
jgi:hypothetical protein